MGKNIGIWIDHEKGFIVSIIDEVESIKIIRSNVEGRIRLSGGSRSRTPFGPQDVAKEKKLEGRRTQQLRRYYQEIIYAMSDAGKILIFGPGEAKIELEKALKKSKELSSIIVGVEPADKMTEKQIAAKVRKVFRIET
jgi:hypothetical protein